MVVLEIHYNNFVKIQNKIIIKYINKYNKQMNYIKD